MRYIDVKWIHDKDDYPVRLVSEIDSSNLETRKLEFFSCGKVGFAYGDIESEGTVLGHVEVPHISEINAHNEFQGSEITKEKFELHWSKHVPSNS